MSGVIVPCQVQYKIYKQFTLRLDEVIKYYIIKQNIIRYL